MRQSHHLLLMFKVVRLGSLLSLILSMGLETKKTHPFQTHLSHFRTIPSQYRSWLTGFRSMGWENSSYIRSVVQFPMSAESNKSVFLWLTW